MVDSKSENYEADNQDAASAKARKARADQIGRVRAQKRRQKQQTVDDRSAAKNRYKTESVSFDSAKPSNGTSNNNNGSTGSYSTPKQTNFLKKSRRSTPHSTARGTGTGTGTATTTATAKRDDRVRNSNNAGGLFKEKEYLDSDQLAPLTGNPSTAFRSVLQTLRNQKAEWSDTFKSLNTLRSIATHHIDVVSKSDLHSVILSVLKAVENLRSSVAKNALLCLGDVLKGFRRRMDPEIITILPVLLKRCADTNKFVNAEAVKVCFFCNKHPLVPCKQHSLTHCHRMAFCVKYFLQAMDQLILNCSYGLVLSGLAAMVGHNCARDARVRTIVAKSLRSTLEIQLSNLGSATWPSCLRSDLLAATIRTSVKLAADASADTRQHGVGAVWVRVELMHTHCTLHC